MPEYSRLGDICQGDSNMSKAIIDDFLLYYAASRDKLDREFETRISRFKDIEKGMPSNWKALIKAQFIAHRIFKKDGLINRYLNHAAIKGRAEKEQNYLRKMAGYPWRFSFSEVRSSPAPDFYEMEDVFTGDVYLLYSRSMSQILSEYPVLLWFNLIGFNGSCWQTYGPVVSFKCFSPDDIFFYATEVNPAIEAEVDLTEDIDENPLRYMMLTAGSNYPLIESSGHEVVQVHGEGHSADFDVQKLGSEFKVEYAEPIFKLTHPVWSEPPHSSEAYYAEESGIVSLTAFTDRGYLEISSLLKKYGVDVPADPDIRIHLPMLTLMEKLFKKRPEFHRYARLFETKKSPESEAIMSKLNQFMALALPYINSGSEPDVDALAKEVGVDPVTARDLFRKVAANFGKMRK